MNKKFNNLIAYVIIVFCLSLFALAWNWYWVKNDLPLQGFIFGLLFSFVGAIVGGLASGYGSYLGGVQGAKENCELLSKEDAEKACRRLFRLVYYTFDRVAFVKSSSSPNCIMSATATLVFDRNWPEYLDRVDIITEDDKHAIVNWLTHIEQVVAYAIIQKRDLTQKEIMDRLPLSTYDKIREINKKLKPKELTINI